ncbi:MAG: amidase [Acidimicrobiales bacterium]|nr:amidase [Acidimicrobiales bacterium]
MTETPWLGDACSLVDAYRSGERSPVEETEACLAAIEASELNAFTHLDGDAALAAARAADPAKPFGGVPIGIKNLERVAGWPDTESSLVFVDRIATDSTTMVERLVDPGGVVPVGMCNAAEFGGTAASTNRAHGTTHNPWKHGRTAGGSSGGSSAAVAGGLVPIATGSDGGGSIRIPAAFCGLLGMKGTAGRIPRGPRTEIAPLMVVKGCQARSVRDAARWYDVCAGHDSRDPYSLPSHGRWEAQLGTFDLSGLKVVVAPDLGSAVVRPEVAANVRAAADALIAELGLVEVDVPVQLPELGLEWAVSGLVQLANDLRDLWPDCKDDLLPEMAWALEMAHGSYDLTMAATVERNRTAANEAMAAVFDEADLIISATNPDVAFDAEVVVNRQVGDQEVTMGNSGALTIPANVSGNPAVSIPIEPAFGLPVGMQIIGRHHQDALLLDLALAMERARPWPLVAPGAPN